MHRRERFCIHQNEDVKLPKSDDHAQANQELDVSAPELHRVRRAIVVVDVVESVRLMQEHEDDVIDRWRRFVAEVRTDVLPKHGGRMVKSLGDGMLLEFEAVPQAVAAAVAIQRAVSGYQRHGDDARDQVWLRMGIHVSEVTTDELDIYGVGVNLADRLSSLAKPGDIVLSVEARDELVPSLDPDVDDMGESWLKHIDEPVRTFRIVQGATSAKNTVPSSRDEMAQVQLVTSIAVVPLRCLAGSQAEGVIGELIADGVIAQLSRTPELTVISRLSTASLRQRDLTLAQVRDLTGAQYVFSGSYAVLDNCVVATVELANATTQAVIWADRVRCNVVALLEQPSEPLDRMAQGAHAAILNFEAQRAATQSLPSLASFSLLYGGVSLLHRASSHDFGRARDALTALCERVPRHGESHAWLAKWHCLRITRGLARFSGPEGKEARWRIQQALDRDPDSALAWALLGQVLCWVDKALDEGGAAYQQALARNPNEPLAWLYTCTLRSWQGRGQEAAVAARQALALSPLDPMRYYFETLAAAGFLANGELQQAQDLCINSLRVNRVHTPTHRVLAIAQMLAGKGDEARLTVRSMMDIQPELTVAGYLDSYPGGKVAHALLYADALREAGLPS